MRDEPLFNASMIGAECCVRTFRRCAVLIVERAFDGIQLPDEREYLIGVIAFDAALASNLFSFVELSAHMREAAGMEDRGMRFERGRVSLVPIGEYRARVAIE